MKMNYNSEGRGKAMYRSVCSRFLGSDVHRVTLSYLAAMMLLPYAPCAKAETAAGTDAASGDQLEQIIVTATKRKADVQDVPISIVALSGDDLVRNRVLSIEDVTRQVPGF